MLPSTSSRHRQGPTHVTDTGRCPTPCPNLTEVARLGQLFFCCSRLGASPSSRVCLVLFPALRLSRTAVCAAIELSVCCSQDPFDLRTPSVLRPDRQGEPVVTNAPQMQNLPVNAGRHNQVEPRSCVDAPNMCIDMHGVAIHANMAGDMERHVSTGPEDTKVPDLPTGSTTPRRDGTDRLESHAGMQTARIHVQDVGNKSNKSANTSVTPDLAANGAVPHREGPNRLESPTDTSDACTHMQSVADDSRRPTDDLECVRKSQNGCKRSNLPVKSLQTRPEEPRKPSNHADASSECTHVQSGRINVKTTARMAKVISILQNEPKTPNLPIGTGCWC